MSELDDNLRKLDEMQTAFLEKHLREGADLIECNEMSGKVMRVIYFSPEYKALEPLREFFRAVAEEENRRRGAGEEK